MALHLSIPDTRIKVSIHPDLGHMGSRPVYPGHRSQAISPPSIQVADHRPGSPSIQTITTEPFTHPDPISQGTDHRPQNHLSIQTIDHRPRSGSRSQGADHRATYPSGLQTTDQGLHPSKVTGHKPTIHPRHQGQGHRSGSGSGSHGYPSIQTHYPLPWTLDLTSLPPSK